MSSPRHILQRATDPDEQRSIERRLRVFELEARAVELLERRVEALTSIVALRDRLLEQDQALRRLADVLREASPTLDVV